MKTARNDAAPALKRVVRLASKLAPAPTYVFPRKLARFDTFSPKKPLQTVFRVARFMADADVVPAIFAATPR